MPSPSDRPNLLVQHKEGGVVVRLIDCDTLNDQSIPRVKDQLTGLIKEEGAVKLLLDLGGVRFMTSDGLGLLVGLHTKVRAAGGHLSLCGVNDALRELF